jgi:hypothetical protein
MERDLHHVPKQYLTLHGLSLSIHNYIILRVFHIKSLNDIIFLKK